MIKTSILAEDQGRILGFQSVKLWQGELHIGTFVQQGIQAKGIGSALFSQTCLPARAAGLLALCACHTDPATLSSYWFHQTRPESPISNFPLHTYANAVTSCIVKLGLVDGARLSRGP